MEKKEGIYKYYTYGSYEGLNCIASMQTLISLELKVSSYEGLNYVDSMIL